MSHPIKPPKLDLLIKNVRVVRPNRATVDPLDVGVKDGRFARIERQIPADEANVVLDAKGLLGFPGAIDAHTHIGIYRHPHDDAPSESASAASGGVTALLSYVRTGSLYLNRGGPLSTFFPELLGASEGCYYTDYGYHVSPIEGRQVNEMAYLLEAGCPNFGEVFMFYGLHGLHGRTDAQHAWLMLGEGDHYDLAHFDVICREAARLQREHPDLAPYLAVSFHCETPELLRAYEHKIQREGKLEGLRAYSAARPPHSEAIAIAVVGAMAHAAGLKGVNILHISSREAVEAALAVRRSYPEVTFGLEATAGHLLLDYGTPSGVFAKVNPPLRSREDVAYLWERVLDGTLEWVVTDHANCPRELKLDAAEPHNIWKAKAGFGGSEYLLPGLFSEGKKRGLSPHRVAKLTAWNPSRRFGLLHKGDIDIGFDADLVLLDPDEAWTVRAEDSLSAQGYTPFEGLELSGRVKRTFLRGEPVYDNGGVVGPARGRHLRRPG